MLEEQMGPAQSVPQRSRAVRYRVLAEAPAAHAEAVSVFTHAARNPKLGYLMISNCKNPRLRGFVIYTGATRRDAALRERLDALGYTE